MKLRASCVLDYCVLGMFDIIMYNYFFNLLENKQKLIRTHKIYLSQSGLIVEYPMCFIIQWVLM